MAQGKRGTEGFRKLGGQRPPQLTANTRTTSNEPEKSNPGEKHRQELKNKIARLRIENDLYERQSS